MTQKLHCKVCNGCKKVIDGNKFRLRSEDDGETLHMCYKCDDRTGPSGRYVTLPCGHEVYAGWGLKKSYLVGKNRCYACMEEDWHNQHHVNGVIDEEDCYLCQRISNLKK